MSIKTWPDYKRLPNSPSSPSQHESGLVVGDKVQVNSLVGVVRFIGTTDFKPGTWAGIELDRVGFGKNDGSMDGPSTPHQKKHDLPKKMISIENNQETMLLQQRIDSLEAENQFLKLHHEDRVPLLQKQMIELETRYEHVISEKNKEIQAKDEKIRELEQMVTEMKKAGMDSVEMLESIVQNHEKKVASLETALSKERNKIQQLVQGQDDLRKAGLEAVESNELTLIKLEKAKEHWKTEKVRLQEEFDKRESQLRRSHHHEIETLLKDITVLEDVLQSKIDKESNLVESLKREQRYSNKLIAEMKSIKLQMKTNQGIIFSSAIDSYRNSSHNRWSVHNRLDTPIQEEEEEDDVVSCTLCGKDDHDLFHCSFLPNRRHTIQTHIH
ncbi:hypothetical protein G6F43_012453 [Rhizopus delemar]|nr:hypothetical protein G6F43_012453 [Rhizopus delemar]